MAYADFQTALTAAAVAFDAGDYDTARKKVTLARIYLAGIPNSSADGVSAQWRESLESLAVAIDKESAEETPSYVNDTEFQQ
jgi:hypothetical protein